MSRLSVTFALALFCACLRAQPASIEGVAINSVTREPLSGVHVRLIPMTFGGSASVYGAMSDGAGHFSIAIIPPGVYIATPERSGFLYVPSKTRAAVPNITVKAGEHRTNWVVDMTPRAVISGRVVDENGDPVQGFQVETAPVSPETAPAPINNSMILSASPGTDDRGEFRIVAPPGKYYVRAKPPEWQENEPPEIRAGGASGPIYGLTFYPSAVSKDRAGVVDAIAGKDVGGIEIRLARQHGLAIHGVVRGLPDGNARPFVTVQTGDNAQTLSGSRGISIGPGGRFTLPAAQPGFYRLWASFMSGKTQLVSPMVEMQIENADPPDVELVLAPGMDITGTLVMEGDPPGAPEEKRTVRLESAGAGIGNILRQSGGEVGRDGAFHIENIAPARFRVRVDPLPENGFVKSVDVDGAASPEATVDGTVDFSNGRVSHLKIALSRAGAQLTGKVLDENGQPLAAPLAMVFLMQDPNNIQPQPAKLVLPGGRYSIKGVRPGKYRICAVEIFRFAGGGGQDFMRKLFDRAEEIEIKEGDRLSKDLRMLPAEEADAKPKP